MPTMKIEFDEAVGDALFAYSSKLGVSPKRAASLIIENFFKGAAEWEKNSAPAEDPGIEMTLEFEMPDTWANWVCHNHRHLELREIIEAFSEFKRHFKGRSRKDWFPEWRKWIEQHDRSL